MLNQRMFSKIFFLFLFLMLHCIYMSVTFNISLPPVSPLTLTPLFLHHHHITITSGSGTSPPRRQATQLSCKLRSDGPGPQEQPQARPHTLPEGAAHQGAAVASHAGRDGGRCIGEAGRGGGECPQREASAPQTVQSPPGDVRPDRRGELPAVPPREPAARGITGEERVPPHPHPPRDPVPGGPGEWPHLSPLLLPLPHPPLSST